ncbi:MAG: hypothetical protein ACTHK7_04435 [Aureliella sp.]
MAGLNITTVQLLDQFRQFALQRLSNEGKELSLDELYDEWRTQNPTNEAIGQDRRAVAASLRDFDRGERGRPVGQFVAEFKKKNGLE